MAALGDLIRQRIDATGETQIDFARRAGVSDGLVSGWVRGSRQLKEFPSVTTMRGLAQALGVPQSVVVQAVAEELGVELELVDTSPATSLLIASTKKLSEGRIQHLARIAESLADDDDRPNP